MFRSFHVRLIVADFDGCFRFYRDVLRLEVTVSKSLDSLGGQLGPTPEL